MFKLPFFKKSLTTPTNSTLMLPHSSNSKFHEENYKEYIPEPNIDITWSYEYDKSKDIYTAKIIFNRIPRNYLFLNSNGFSTIIVMVTGDRIFLRKYGYGEEINVEFSINVGEKVEITCSDFEELKNRVDSILYVFKKIQKELDGHEGGVTSFKYTSFLYHKKLNFDNLYNISPSLSECEKLMTSHRVKDIIRESGGLGKCTKKDKITLNTFLTEFKHIKILYISNLSRSIINNYIKIIPLEEEIGKTYNFKE